MQLKRVRRNWWKLAILVLLPVVPLWVIAAKRSWLPRELHLSNLPVSDYPTARIISMKWSMDNHTLVIGVSRSPYQSELELWDTSNKHLLRTIHTKEVSELCFNEAGDKLAGTTDVSQGDTDLHITIWKFPQLTAVQHIALVKLERDQDVRVWFDQSSALKYSMNMGATILIKTLSAQPPADFTLSVPKSSYIYGYDIHGKRCLIISTPPSQEPATGERLTLYAMEHGHATTKWQTRVSASLLFTSNNVRFSPDGKMAASTLSKLGGGGPITVRRVADGFVLWTSNESTRSTEFSPDGRLVAQDQDSRVVLRDAQTGKVQRILPRPSYQKKTLSLEVSTAFSPDSSMLAVAADNGTVTLWRVR